MIPTIRVLVVDDSVVVRRLVSDVLGEDPSITVVGTAANGKLALAKIAQSPPDLVTLDVEMPELDGLGTLAAIRKTHPALPVIMFSSLTRRAASATIEALTLGANDYVTKPEGVGGLDAARDRIRAELLPKIKALCPGPAARERIAVSAAPRPPAPRADAALGLRIVVIGVSTGGPPALTTLLSALPADLGVPILIVQHMPPVFTELLAKRLALSCALRVDEAVSGTVVEPGRIWLAAGDHHLVVERQAGTVVLRTTQGPPECSCRPSVDVLFRSVAEVYGDAALGVVLTGMGQDGLRGTEQLRARGAMVLAQDAATSVVWGMPGAIVKAGLADRVLPIGELAGEITRRVRRARQTVRIFVAAER